MTNKGKRRMCLFLFFLLTMLTAILKSNYRVYIYENNIFDYHFADTFVNIIYVPACTCLYYYFAKNPKNSLGCIIAMLVAVLIMYEFLCLFVPYGAFDIYDIIATIGSGVATYLLLKHTSILPKPENNKPEEAIVE